MRLIILMLALSGLLGAQAIFFPLDLGVVPATGCNPVVTRPCAVVYTDQTLPIISMVYSALGDPLVYPKLSVPNGAAMVVLSFVEPNKTAAGQRVFTVRVNDTPPITVDVFKMTGGAKKRLDIPLLIDVEGGGIRLELRASAGNAMISQIKVVSLISILTSWMTCVGDTGPASNCDGLNYVRLMPPGGTPVVLLGASPPAGFVPTAQFVQKWP